MPKNAIIVGMPRSGTSLIASIFARQGYFAGEDCRPADHFNPMGYWECAALVEANARILHASGFAHHNSWMYDALSPSHLDAIEKMQAGEAERGLLRSFSPRRPWIWKDPRLCYTLGVWWPLLNPADTQVLLVIREPDAIFNSFVRVGWRKDSDTDREETHRRVRDHLAFARATIKKLGITAVQIDYDDIGADPVGTARRISEAFDVYIPPDQLGFDETLNHNTKLGRAAARVDRIATAIPAPFRRFIRMLTPEVLLRWLFPERFR